MGKTPIISATNIVPKYRNRSLGGFIIQLLHLLLDLAYDGVDVLNHLMKIHNYLLLTCQLHIEGGDLYLGYQVFK